jgi:hypothetical protein
VEFTVRTQAGASYVRRLVCAVEGDTGAFLKAERGVMYLAISSCASCQAIYRTAHLGDGPFAHREEQEAGLMNLGEALAAAAQANEAQTCYASSVALFERIGLPHGALQARAQHAEMALERGDLATAMAEIEVIVTALQSDLTLDGTDEPRRIELVCHRVLAAVGDERAAKWLVQAHTRLMAQAAHFEGAARERFLTNVPWNRIIIDRFANIGLPEPPAAETPHVP